MTEQTPLFLSENDLMVHTPNGNFKLQSFETFSEAWNALDLPILVIIENAGSPNKVKIWDNAKKEYIIRTIGGSKYIDRSTFSHNNKKHMMGRPDNRGKKGVEKGYWLAV